MGRVFDLRVTVVFRGPRDFLCDVKLACAFYVDLLPCRYQSCPDAAASKCYLGNVFRYSCLCHATLSVPVQSIGCHTQATADDVVRGSRPGADHLGVTLAPRPGDIARSRQDLAKRHEALCSWTEAGRWLTAWAESLPLDNSQPGLPGLPVYITESMIPVGVVMRVPPEALAQAVSLRLHLPGRESLLRNTCKTLHVKGLCIR